MLRKKVFLYVSFVKSVQFVCAIIMYSEAGFYDPIRDLFYFGQKLVTNYT